MSIIADALKKAEVEKQVKKNPVQNTLTTSVESSQSIKRTDSVYARTRKNKWPLSFIFVALLILVVVAGSLFFVSKQKSVIIVPATAKQSDSGIEFSFDVQPKNVTLAPISSALKVAESPKALALTVPVPVAEPAKSEFILSGIIDDPVTPSAIINNEIVEVGEVVHGAKVVRIDAHRVVLEKDNREISLAL
ncbi:MAG: hypothetical protein HZC17_04365 [Candidatus Omnitrophica bacterium]|nr:hypothetical protein [Candidatus Omnitrophota bacterium]